MDLPARFTLNSGLQIPSVGPGTFQGDEGNGKVKDAVKLAIRLGYRHIDGASAYGNEKEIGEALEESSIAREELSVTHRLTLQLQLAQDKQVLEVVRITPAVNQVELHPFLSQEELLEYSQSKGILLMAHQPLGGRPVSVVRAHPDEPFPTEHPDIKAVAEQSGTKPAQVCLAWSVQRGVPVVPKSVTEAHLVQNLQLKKLPESLFQIVDGLSAAKGHLRFLDPSHHLGFDIFDETEDQPTGNSAPWD